VTFKIVPSFLTSSKEGVRATITLYRFTLAALALPASPPTYFFADSDTDVLAFIANSPQFESSVEDTSNSTQFLFQAFGHKRTASKNEATMQVGTMDITIPNARLLFNNVETNVGFMAQYGLLDKAQVDMFRYNAKSPGSRCPWWGTWFVSSVTVDRKSVTLRCESAMTLLTREAPRTIYGPLCNNRLFDSWCGMLRSAYASTYAATSSDQTTITFLISGTNPAGAAIGATGYYDGGELIAQTGPNFGVRRSIRSHTQAGGVGTITLLTPLPFAAQVGDSFQLVPGCDKTILTCQNKYNNVNPASGRTDRQANSGAGGYRGTPDIPTPESVGIIIT
jgi:uncharacterized phage protein (TIGR02218 family)